VGGIVSDAAVTRDGLEGVRPGREARMWDGGGRRRRQRPAEHPGDSYYGQPIINPPVWEEREIAGYLFTGGLAGASSLLAAGAQLTDRPYLARRSRICASGAIAVSLAALVKDLGRPERFLHMLRVFKPTSPMSVGTWILVVYAPLNLAATASDISGKLPRSGRIAGLGAAFIGPAVASYTAALIADTAVPAWHEGRRELPFVFVGSAASAAAGWGLIAAPIGEASPARRMAIAGAVLELAAEQLLERRLGIVAETLRDGVAGTRLTAAKRLTVAGIAGAAVLAPRHRLAAAAAGAALLAASALTRFGLFAAGMASARDPKYTVQPQRDRLAGRASASRP
jgi:formate-dependent nitrite reductase membrane component NrfD